LSDSWAAVGDLRNETNAKFATVNDKFTMVEADIRELKADVGELKADRPGDQGQ